MTPLELIGCAFFAPGKVGLDSDRLGARARRDAAWMFLFSLLLPATCLSWILLYSASNANALLLAVLYNTPLEIFGLRLAVAAAVPVLAGFIILLFWFLPAMLLLGFSRLGKKERPARGGKGGAIAFFRATSASFSLFHPAIWAGFYVMLIGGNIFAGLRTAEDTFFTVILLGCIVYHVTSQATIIKNLTGTTLEMVIAGGIVYGVVLVILIALILIL